MFATCACLFPLLDSLTILPACVSVCAAYRIAGWTEAQQQAWIDRPTGPAAFHDCIGIVDATYISVLRPKDTLLERRLYSTYKKRHAVYFVVVVDRQGTSASELCCADKQAADVRHFCLFVTQDSFAIATTAIHQ